MREVNDMVLECVNNFWKDLDIDEEQLVIATDQMILIYLYIITRAKIVDMFANLNYITAFTTPYVRQSNLGFLLATYEHALYTLVEHSKQDLENRKGRNTQIIDLTRGANDSFRGTFSEHSLTRATWIPEAFNKTTDEFVEFSEASSSYLRPN